MKKIILTSAIILGTVVATFAQTTGASDNVTLSVKLHAIQTLVVNDAQKAVNLEYKNIGDYANGVKSTQADHLKIYSTGGFAVTVSSTVDDIKRASGTETIEASSIKVKAETGATSSLDGATLSEVPLSIAGKTIIKSAVGGVDKNFNITYSGMSGNGYLNKYFNAESPTIYTTTVTYTIAAQ